MGGEAGARPGSVMQRQGGHPVVVMPLELFWGIVTNWVRCAGGQAREGTTGLLAGGLPGGSAGGSWRDGSGGPEWHLHPPPMVVKVRRGGAE